MLLSLFILEMIGYNHIHKDLDVFLNFNHC